MSNDPGAAAILVKLLRSRRVQVHTRRSAALGLRRSSKHTDSHNVSLAISVPSRST